MKKKIIIIISSIIAIVMVVLGVFLYFIGATGKESEEVTLIVKSGSTSKQIINTIYNSGLIRNKYAGYAYLYLHKYNNLQAGTYRLNKGMNLKNILDNMNKGEGIVKDEVKITFVEGKRLLYFIKQISDSFNYSEEEILNVINNKDFLNKLIEKYWFLTDEILNKSIYYPLEGYLYPETYLFSKNASIEEIIEKMLDESSKKLLKYKEQIEKSEFSVHEILSMASIVELEAVNDADRSMVAQVIYKRLKLNMTLGMDVTTYYAVKKDMKEELWVNDLNVVNPYNTRVAPGLPVGPICNSSISSIKAVFNPSETDYLYFYADVKTGKVYFAKNESEFYELIRKYG